MVEIQTYFLGISKISFYKCVIYGEITISANKKNLIGAERFSFSGQQFPELFLTIEIIIDETLQDTIRYVLILERLTGGNISEAQTVIITWETTGKRYKSFCCLTGKSGRKRLLYNLPYDHKWKLHLLLTFPAFISHLSHFCAEHWSIPLWPMRFNSLDKF